MATALRPSVEDCWLLTSPGRWTCTVCKNGVEHSRSHRKRHISTMGHKNALEYIAYAHQPMAELPDQNRPRSAPPQAPRTPSPHIDISFDTEALSTAIKAYGEGSSNAIDLSADDEEELEPGFLRGDSDQDSGNEIIEWLHRDPGDVTHDSEDLHESIPPQSTTSDEWYPWRSRAALTLDLVMNLPRSTFSMRQIDVMRWLLKANSASQVPSSKTIQLHNAALHNMCGVRSLQYTGAFGNTFYVNSLADLISQEMANPRVRPHLHFYPEDAGRSMSEYWHAKHWHESADPDLVTPLATINGRPFFVYEPCLLTNGLAIIPYRWFVRGKLIMARAWPLRPIQHGDGAGWIVEEFETVVVSQAEFLVPFGLWATSQLADGFPDAAHIIGSLLEPNGSIVTWTRTDPKAGNRWRALAGGARVVSFPLWLYCDDVSGNQSKKWNKHHSFLFSAAGLPRSLSQQEYNVHFLCTSNLAPPLEMLDKIVTQLEEAWVSGIWAWDCVLKDCVLVIPFVVALLGDNPMQSEFACHLGQGGKFFCRMCEVKGFDSALDPSIPLEPGQENQASGHLNGTSGESSNEDTRSATGGRRRRQETMQEMVDRVSRFIKIGLPRSREKTLGELQAIAGEAGSVGNLTKIRSHKTMTGLKDTFLEVFLGRMYASYKEKVSKSEKQRALDVFRATLPANIFSPVWRIRGLDPHADTPVEILHTVLLGFVKYFWRDAINNQLSGSAQKDLLKSRINSLDISGLQIGHRLPGNTLVQYAGSLTGRDFRVIAQIAPFVLYDLVSPTSFAAWVSLSNLVPLIWQPEIEDIEDYTEHLESAIQEFHLRTISWTPRWFNKPKFHFLLHLPLHIRRFGPAVLFATEAFESFNAVIRAKSVHSNRLAPSRDIASAFAHNNRVRHLLSGGRHFFRDNDQSQKYLDAFRSLIDHDVHGAFSVHAGMAGIWRRVSTVALSLADKDSPIASYVGVTNKDKQSAGTCVLDKCGPCPYNHTKMAQLFPTFFSPLTLSCRRGVSMRLTNGDLCRGDDWVLFKSDASGGAVPALGRIKEIVAFLDPTTANTAQPTHTVVLLQRMDIGMCVEPYRMPSISFGNNWLILEVSSILCTANTQHRCYDHQCATSKLVPVYQERQLTDRTRALVQHHAPDNLVLNTARMRDGARFNQLRVRSRINHHDVSAAILQGAQEEVDGRKRQIGQGGGLLQKRRVSSFQRAGRAGSSRGLTSASS